MTFSFLQVIYKYIQISFLFTSYILLISHYIHIYIFTYTICENEDKSPVCICITCTWIWKKFFFFRTKIIYFFTNLYICKLIYIYIDPHCNIGRHICICIYIYTLIHVQIWQLMFHILGATFLFSWNFNFISSEE